MNSYDVIMNSYGTYKLNQFFQSSAKLSVDNVTLYIIYGYEDT